MDTMRAEKKLRDLGAIFGEKEIAEEAIGDLQFYLAKGDDPVLVGWGIFLDLLEVYERLESAFWHAIYRANIQWWLTRRMKRQQDAEDVFSIAAFSAWHSLRSYSPDRMSWDGWIKMIASRKLKTHLRSNFYHDRESLVELFDDVDRLLDGILGNLINIEITREMHLEQEEEKTGEYIAVKTVAERWISGGHPGKARFAARVLATLNNEEDHIGLSGSIMQSAVGVSRPTLSAWSKQFILEVHGESKG